MKQFIKNCVVAFVISVPSFVFSVFCVFVIVPLLSLPDITQYIFFFVIPLIASTLLIYFSNRRNLKNSKNKSAYFFLNIILPAIIGTFLCLFLQYLKMYGYIDGNTFF